MDDDDEQEVASAEEALRRDDVEDAFRHLERAHFARIRVPQGNHGRARVRAFPSLPVPDELRHLVP
jgi:hypothetical protein